ncbi:fimbrin-2, partial [Fagus crenata]
NGLSTQTKQISFLETLPDDTLVSKEERAFRFWMNSLGNSTYINNVFDDLRNGWVLLETLDKVSLGIVNWICNIIQFLAVFRFTCACQAEKHFLIFMGNLT